MGTTRAKFVARTRGHALMNGATSERHPEEARSAVSKDVWHGAWPVSFEARIRSRLRMTGEI